MSSATEIIEMFEKADLLPYEVARIVTVVIEKEVKDQVDFTELDGMADNAGLLAFYLAAYTYAN